MDEQVRVPDATVSAMYGSWPMWLFALLGLAIHYPTLIVGALVVGLLRAGLRFRHVRRNNLSVSSGVLRVTSEGVSSDLMVRDVQRTTWHFGFWAPTLDRLGNYTGVSFEMRDGQRVFVELLIPTRSGQYRAARALAQTIGGPWLFRWPFGVRQDLAWEPGQPLP